MSGDIEITREEFQTSTEVAALSQAVAKQTKSVLIDMASKYGMEPQAFEATVRATCMPANATREEFAAYLLVAKEYNLNPLTKEIFAFPKRGGGIVPIVSIDGWISLVNSHPACDGWEFHVEHGEKGELISCTCHMYRKDRGRPVVITEYLEECFRPTEPWKMKHRMLRHKTMVQTARYAFGFSGIYDEDEGEKISQAKDITPKDTVRKEPPAPPEATTVEKKEPPSPDTVAKSPEKPKETKKAPVTIDHEPEQEKPAEKTPAKPKPEPQAKPEPETQIDDDPITAFLERYETALEEAASAEDFEDVISDFDAMAHFESDEENQMIAATMVKRFRRQKGF